MIYAVEWILNKTMLIFFSIILLYGIYAVWDSVQIDRQADASKYEMYRPDDQNSLTFEKLQKMNPEVFGWIRIYKTHIDYPLVQAENNHKYINTDAEGKFSLAGSIFLDCRNKKDFSDVNNIIYGHHMRRKKMFGELELFQEAKYFKEHHYGKLYYEGKWHKIELFAFLKADANDSMIYNTDFVSESGSQEYLNYIKRRAQNFRELNFKKQETFVTLSTCTSTSANGRYIVVARII